jgi:hypothetical protein
MYSQQERKKERKKGIVCDIIYRDKEKVTESAAHAVMCMKQVSEKNAKHMDTF